MTGYEFRAWFEGFAEGIGEAPNAEQWARIKGRVEEIARPPAIMAPPYAQIGGGGTAIQNPRLAAQNAALALQNTNANQLAQMAARNQ